MASLKTLKIRIGSVKSTQKITKALNMVAASKLRRAQQNAEDRGSHVCTSGPGLFRYCSRIAFAPQKASAPTVFVGL